MGAEASVSRGMSRTKSEALLGGQMLFPLLHFSLFLEMISSQWQRCCPTGHAIYILTPSLGFETHQTERVALNVELILENPLAGAVMC